MRRRKLILFDIDGTLIAPGPVPRAALAEAISQAVGEPVTLTFLDVAGQTDPTIISNALARYRNGATHRDADVPRILEQFLRLVEERLPQAGPVRVFPGAEALVRACGDENWATALLTGNVQRGARLKLAGTGLWDLFAFGVFGDDGNTREDLPWIARERAWDTLHESFRPVDTVIIGDTPNDARIARLNGSASLIVCRRAGSEWRQAIKAEGPTWLVDGFDDVPALVNMMKGTAA
ncbi:MAG: haloacid dehalogenase-like hydrolase [Candidatus Marinimicrobia bacterium]|nr:haloacid dehalogenase-like hydrolase [Candidatus Neomarinimicrobiota bacterium]